MVLLTRGLFGQFENSVDNHISSECLEQIETISQKKILQEAVNLRNSKKFKRRYSAVVFSYE